MCLPSTKLVGNGDVAAVKGILSDDQIGDI